MLLSIGMCLGKKVVEGDNSVLTNNERSRRNMTF